MADIRLIKSSLICLLPLLAATPAECQPAGYSQSATLTINHTQVPNTDQVHFPLLVAAQANSMKGTVWGGQMQSPNAYDIVFSSDAAGTMLLPYERVRHDLTLGRVVYWVQVPTLSHTADTTIYAWFGNPAVSSDQSNPTAVWDANYKGVWHLTENLPTTAVQDSTANGHQGNSSSPTNTHPVLGKIDNLTAFNYHTQSTSGDYTSIPSSSGGDLDFTSSNFTFEFWLNAGALPPAGEDAVFGNGGPNSNQGSNQFGYALYAPNGQGKLAFVDFGGSSRPLTSLSTSRSVTTGVWTHVAIVRNGSSLTFYLNGTQDASTTSFVAPSSSSAPLILGELVGYGNSAACLAAWGGCFVGSLEEFRASNTNRSADWIAASFNNQNNPATFFSSVSAGWDLSSSSTPPVCSAGAAQSFRAGYPATLDGSGSYSPAGLPLSYFWQSVPSVAVAAPQQRRLQWSSHAVVKPTIKGLVFGPANFQLTVTQSDGASTSCTVNHGAVATDDNGTVITATGNAALDSAIYNLLGPMVQLGKNPWPYYDQAAVADAAVQIAAMDTVYPDYWDTPAQGTISVTPGSKTVVGNGTNFLSTFCNADGSVNSHYLSNGVMDPNCPTDGNYCSSPGLVVWYPLNDPNYPAGATGRRIVPNSGPYITACKDNSGNPSDTQLTLNQTWFNDVSACPTGQNPPCWLQYSVAFGPPPGNSGGTWQYNTAPADFYDSVVAYYALYYRSGQDFYLINARKWADRVWAVPENDRGNTYQQPYAFTWTPQFRNWSMMGLVLRALDTADGHPDMWPGLHKVWAKTMGGYWLGYYPSSIGVTYFDAREYAYGLAQLSYCAMFDEDITWQQTCRAAIKNTFSTSGSGYLNVWPQQYAINFYQLAYSQSGKKASWTQGASVHLQNGSTAVTCNGSCGWASSDWPFSTTSGVGGHPVWFTNTTTTPPLSNADGDPDAYCYQIGQLNLGCTFVDANHFTLDRAYNEPGCDPPTGCTKGWVFSITGSGGVGWSASPFFEGILAFGLDLAGRAMACTGMSPPMGCDAPTSNLAYQYATGAANWIMTYGYRPSTYGMFYSVGGPVCPLPVSESNGWCTNSGGSAIASREYAADGLRGMMVYYQRTGDPAAKAMLDTIYAALWGKPGTNPIVPSPDGTYDNNFDTGSGNGFWLTPGLSAGKLFGQMFGFGRGDNWPALRVGGVETPRNVTLYIGGRIGDIPGATRMQITVTEPTGVMDAPVVCSSSPCPVTVNAAAGNPVIEVDYLSPNGAVLHAGQPYVATVK